MIGYQLKEEDNRWSSSSELTQDQALKKFSSDLSDGVRGGSVAHPFRLLYGKTRWVFGPITLFTKYPGPCIWTIMSKKRFQSACPDSFPESVTPSDFVALDLRSSLPEFIMEMERAGGRMRIHIKGAPGFHPLELMETFWGRG